MKSIRLNNQIRQDIKGNIIKVWMAENPKPDISDACRLLAIKIRENDDSNYTEVFKAWQELGDYFVLETYTKFQTEQGEFGYISHKPIPKTKNSRDGALSVSTLWSEYKEYESANEAFQNWSRKLEKLRSEIGVIMDSVNTSNQLIEAWPDVEKYVQPLIREGKTNLPAIPIDRVNEILGWTNE